MGGSMSTELLVNETMARQMGFANPADAVGKFLDWDKRQIPVVGVMADFHLASVRTVIHPLIFYTEPRYGYVMHIALRPSPDSWNAAIAKMQTAWKAVYPAADFDYKFLDKTIASSDMHSPAVGKGEVK